MNSDLTAGVSPENGAIMNEGHVEPLLGCGDGGRTAGDSTADDDQIELFNCPISLCGAGIRPSKFLKSFALIRGRRFPR